MAITKVQETTSRTASGGSTTKTFAITAPAAGSTLVLCSHGAGADFTSVSGGGVTWSKTDSFVNAAAARCQLWVGPNSSGSGTTISIVVTSTYVRWDCNFTEWSGMPAATTADGGSNANTTSPNITTPSVTPAATGQPVLLIALAAIDSTTVSAGPTGGFTALSTTGLLNTTAYAYQIAAVASGAYQCGWTTAAGYGTRVAGLYAFDGTAAASGKLFRPSNIDGVGSGGPFFSNQLGA